MTKQHKKHLNLFDIISFSETKITPYSYILRPADFTFKTIKKFIVVGLHILDYDDEQIKQSDFDYTFNKAVDYLCDVSQNDNGTINHLKNIYMNFKENS